MGEKKGHTSTSGQRDPLDLTIADAADSQLLDDEAVRDILETGTYRVLDQSIGDSQDDKDKTDLTNTFVPYDNLTSRTKLLKTLGRLLGREDTSSTIDMLEARVMLEEITEGTTARHRYQPNAARVSWARRLLNLFSSN